MMANVISGDVSFLWFKGYRLRGTLSNPLPNSLLGAGRRGAGGRIVCTHGVYERFFLSTIVHVHTLGHDIVRYIVRAIRHAIVYEIKRVISGSCSYRRIYFLFS